MRPLFALGLFLFLAPELKAQQNWSINTNLTFAGGDNKHGLTSLQTGIDYIKLGSFAFGLYSGAESQSSDTFTVSAIPLFLNFQYILRSSEDKNQYIYFHFRPGISFAYDVTSKFKLDSALVPQYGNLKSADPLLFLKNDFFYTWGFGYQSRKGLHFELAIRNQPTNLYAPYQMRNGFLCISIGYRIK